MNQNTARLRNRVLVVTFALLMAYAIVSPTRRFGTGADDPVDVIGDGGALDGAAPQVALFVYGHDEEATAWAARTSLRAVEPRMTLVSVPVREQRDAVRATVAKEVVFIETLCKLLHRNRGKVIVASLAPVVFYRPFSQLVHSVLSADPSLHTLQLASDDASCNAAMHRPRDNVYVIRANIAGLAFWDSVRKRVVHRHRWVRNRCVAGEVQHAARKALGDGGKQGHAPGIGCLPRSFWAASMSASAGSALPDAPVMCVADRAAYGELAPELFRSHPAAWMRLFTIVETECGTVRGATSIDDLRAAQHLSRSPFVAYDVSPTLKGNVIVLQLPAADKLPLARWMSLESLRAYERDFHFRIVPPQSDTGRDPTPEADKVAAMLEEWQRVSPADAKFVWVSGPAVASGPFIDTLSLRLHDASPVIVVGECSNVQVVVALNNAAAGAALRDCEKNGIAVDHELVYVVTSATTARQPDTARLCVLDNDDAVKTLAGESSNLDAAMYTFGVLKRCGSAVQDVSINRAIAATSTVEMTVQQGPADAHGDATCPGMLGGATLGAARAERVVEGRLDNHMVHAAHSRSAR